MHGFCTLDMPKAYTWCTIRERLVTFLKQVGSTKNMSYDPILNACHPRIETGFKNFEKLPLDY